MRRVTLTGTVVQLCETSIEGVAYTFNRPVAAPGGAHA